MRSRKRQQGGFTLVEVLISLILSVIAMVGVMALYRAQSNASSFSRRNTEATMLAEQQLETLRTQTGGVAVSGSLTIDENGVFNAAGPFTRFHQITPINIGVAPTAITYDDIQVSVSWTEEGLTKTVTTYGRRTR